MGRDLLTVADLSLATPMSDALPRPEGDLFAREAKRGCYVIAERKGGRRGKHRFPPAPKEEWPLGRPLRGGRTGEDWVTQVFVGTGSRLVPLSGGIADHSEAVALLLERIGVVVVAVALPEARTVVRRQLDPP